MVSLNICSSFIKQTAYHSRRNIAVASVAFNKVADPIQKLFLDKLQEYKSKSAGGKVVDSSPEIEQQRKNELERVSKQFGGGSGVDMTQFPAIKFEEPEIDPINQS